MDPTRAAKGVSGSAAGDLVESAVTSPDSSTVPRSAAAGDTGGMEPRQSGTAEPGWEVMTGAALGGMHARAGMPLQDAVGWWPGPRDDGGEHAEEVVLAVADGHGSRECFRSDRGARLAVGWACLAGAEALADGKFRSGQDGDSYGAAKAMVADIVDRWRASVQADLVDSPPVEEEIAGTSLGWPTGNPSLAYGTTLLLAVASWHSLILAQLGDGQILTVDPGGHVSCPMPPDPVSVAGATSSLAQADAASACRITVVDLVSAPLNLVLLSSDGYGNAFVDPDWQLQVGRDVDKQLREDGPVAVRARLGGWLVDAANACGDDATVAILTRPAG